MALTSLLRHLVNIFCFWLTIKGRSIYRSRILRAWGEGELAHSCKLHANPLIEPANGLMNVKTCIHSDGTWRFCIPVALRPSLLLQHVLQSARAEATELVHALGHPVPSCQGMRAIFWLPVHAVPQVNLRSQQQLRETTQSAAWKRSERQRK